MGEYPKANKILNEINKNYCLDDLSLIYEVSKTQGDIPTALSALSELYYNLDSVFRYSMKLNFNQKLSELHNYEQETYKSELNRDIQ